MAVIDIEDFKEFYAGAFGTGKESKLSAADEKRLAAIVKYLDDTMRNASAPRMVEVIGARVAIETVEVYGLEITVDANGNAVHISSPHGFHTDAA